MDLVSNPEFMRNNTKLAKIHNSYNTIHKRVVLGY